MTGDASSAAGTPVILREMLSHAMATPRVVRTAAVVAVLVLALPLLLRPATPAQEVPATRSVDLVEHVAPRGRPLPADARSNDCWIQHIAIIVNDIDQAHLWLKRHGVERT